MVPRREALLGNTFETRKTSSRRPSIASAITSSASPYISAVSIWLMPRSSPWRSAATARLRSPRSRYQVPCPITEVLQAWPKGRCFIRSPQAADVGDHHGAGRGFRDVDLLAFDRDIGAG